MLNPRDVQSLLSRLDRDWDGSVSYEEFKEIFNLNVDNNIKSNYSSQNQQLENNLNSSGVNFNNNQVNTQPQNEEKVEEQDEPNSNVNNEERQEENKKLLNSNEVDKNSPNGEYYNNNNNNVNNNLNQNQQKNMNFANTMSTIKGFTSPLRESALDELNLRASMNTYSPNRVNPTNHGFNVSQTQPRINNNLKSPFIGNQFSQQLNYDYNSKYPGLIRSVDRMSKYRTTGTSYNQSRYPVNNNNSNSSLNYSLSNFNNSKEEFFNQNYRSKLKSNSPNKYLANNKTYTSPRKDNYKLTDIKEFKRDTNLTYNRPLNNTNFAQNFNSSTSFNKTVNHSKSEIEALLAKFFQELIQIETNIEAIKESLSLKTDVKLDLIFSCFDLSKKSLVSVPDFIETLKTSLDIFSGVEDIKLLFKRFDQDLDCKLR
jgi:Ca2+-binding EF-hand superfamily protein